MIPVRSAVVCLGLGAMSLGCGAAENAAARDPMKCERDPNCSRGRASYADCTKQCVDDPACTDRCGQVQKQTDSLGH
jgi:hypothetical protein